jgi:hypothetical protein
MPATFIGGGHLAHFNWAKYTIEIVESAFNIEKGKFHETYIDNKLTLENSPYSITKSKDLE